MSKYIRSIMMILFLAPLSLSVSAAETQLFEYGGYLPDIDKQIEYDADPNNPYQLGESYLVYEVTPDSMTSEPSSTKPGLDSSLWEHVIYVH